MNTLTLQGLRRLVGSTRGKRLPTARALRENGDEIVASMIFGTDVQLIVYRNGFYIYETETGTTVYAVDRCEGYTYDGGETVDTAMFEDANWALCLVLAGEDRLEHNNNIREQGNHFSYSADTTERGDLRDPHDFVADIESREAVEDMLGCLTEKQRKVAQMHFQEGMTQQETAMRLNMSQPMIIKHIRAIRRRLKKTFSTFF
ncbi:sigma-70 family RNA polymerase sigma factor [Eubacteriales bacterium OttesenSCG-928-A19]|nr:sigma-70 family RNA polymerase sigma factor [Eubacteriales bacterium OttesenSCG-928-A19]